LYNTYLGWKLIKSEYGIDVYRKFMAMGTFGSKYAMVKASGILSSSPKSVMELFEDNTRYSFGLADKAHVYALY
jgi:hypothetical protein